MQATDLRVALFSGNYNYIRDGANQTLNLLVGHLLSARREGPHLLADEPAAGIPAGRAIWSACRRSNCRAGGPSIKLARGLPASVRRDLEDFAPNLIHVSAPEILGHRAVTYARKEGLPWSPPTTRASRPIRNIMASVFSRR